MKPSALGLSFLVTFSLAWSVSFSAHARSCVEALHAMLSRNPRDAPVGLAYVHEYRIEATDVPAIVKLVVPAPPRGVSAHIVDLAAQKTSDRWPRRFVISGGLASDPFLLVDLTPGSSLDRQLDLFLDDMKSRGTKLDDIEAVLRDLKNHGKDSFESKANKFKGAKSPAFAQEDFELGPVANRMFNDYSVKRASNQVESSGENRKLVPFEFFLARPDCTLCIHNALLSSFLLDKLNIPHRVRPGFAAFGGPSMRNTGHTLIELGDGRLLDPTWNFIKAPKPNPKYPDWLEGAGWWWTANTHYPYVVLD